MISTKVISIELDKIKV